MMATEDEKRIADGNQYIRAVTDSFPKFLRELQDIGTTLKIVDVGANPVDGPAPYAPLLTSGRAHVVGFEPNPQALAQLNAKKGPFETYLPHAIGDGRRHVLNICALPGMTSLLKPNPAILSLFYGFSAWGRVVDTLDVDTKRLDDVPETADVDLLKIDIQGAELMAFQNAAERLKSTLVIHTEVEFLPMYTDQPLFSEVEQFLRRAGFVLHKFAPLVTRDFHPMLLNYEHYINHSQVFWADAIFVRDFTRLDLLSAEQLLRTAEILYDCYQSYDLVLFLLREHDRRTGGDFGKKFLEMARPIVNEH